jgi:broad specificity phosphatase PhoE
MFLYTVRHGQSESKAGASIPDPGLSELGNEQARRAADFLAGGVQVAPKVHGPQPEIVICSPLRRAMQTAHILADAFDAHPVHVRHDLHEHGGPRPECLVRETIHTEFPGVVCDPSMPDGPWWPAEDELEEASFARGAQVARWLRDRYTEFEGGVAVVTHSTSGHHMICSLVGHTTLSTTGFAQNNCGIGIFHITNEFTRCWASNSTAHLERDQIT